MHIDRVVWLMHELDDCNATVRERDGNNIVGDRFDFWAPAYATDDRYAFLYAQWKSKERDVGAIMTWYSLKECVIPFRACINSNGRDALTV